MRLRPILLGLALVYGIALIALAPAGLVAGVLQERLGLRFGAIEGRLWAGRLRQVVLPSGRLDRLEWTASPASLLRGAFGAWVIAEGEGQRWAGQVEAGWFGGHRWLDLEARVDLVPWARSLGLPVALAGILELGPVQGALDQEGRWEGVEGELRFDALSLGGGTAIALRATLSASDGTLHAAIRDAGGPLAVTGGLRLAPDLGYHLELDLRPKDAAGSALLRQWRAFGGGVTEAGGRVVLDGVLRLGGGLR